MKKFVLVALAMGLATAAVPADAAISIAYNLNGGGITFLTNDSGTGAASYSGFLNPNLHLQLSATGFPIDTQPTLQTSSLDAQLAGATSPTSLVIYITQTGLDAFSGGLMSAFTSNTLTGNAQSVTLSTLLDAGGALYSGSTMGTATFTSGPATGTSTVNENVGSGFSETAVYSLSFGAGTGSFNDTINISAVPEPATWGMMLLGFLGLGMVLRRRKPALAQLA